MLGSAMVGYQSQWTEAYCGQTGFGWPGGRVGCRWTTRTSCCGRMWANAALVGIDTDRRLASMPPAAWPPGCCGLTSTAAETNQALSLNQIGSARLHSASHDAGTKASVSLVGAPRAPRPPPDTNSLLEPVIHAEIQKSERSDRLTKILCITRAASRPRPCAACAIFFQRVSAMSNSGCAFFIMRPSVPV